MPSTSSCASGTQVASRAIASLPGAQYNRSTRGDAASAQHSACSRPPAPTTRTFMPTPRRDRAVRGCSRLPGEDNSTACGSDRACGRDRDPLRAVLRDEPQVPGQIKALGLLGQVNLRSRQGVGTNESLPVAVLPHRRYERSGPWARIEARDGPDQRGVPDRIGRCGHGHLRAARPGGGTDHHDRDKMVCRCAKAACSARRGLSAEGCDRAIKPGCCGSPGDGGPALGGGPTGTRPCFVAC